MVPGYLSIKNNVFIFPMMVDKYL